MTNSPSGIVEVARSREKFDGQPTIDLTVLEEQDSLELLTGHADAVDENTPSSPSFHSRTARTRNIVIVLLAILALIVGPAYADRALRGTKLAHGVSVSGVDVGSNSISRARATLTRRANKALDTPLDFSLGKDKVSVSSQDLDLKYNVSATLAKAEAVGHSYNPITTIGGFVSRYTVGKNIAPVVTYNQKKLDSVANTLVNEFSRGRSNAGVTLKGTRVSVIKSHSGEGITLDQAQKALRSSLQSFNRSTYTLRSEKVDAQITLAQAQKTASLVRTMLKENSILTTPAGHALTITPEQLAAAIKITPKNNELSLSIDSTEIRSALADQLAPVEVAPIDATFSVSGTTASVLPSVPGKQVDFASALRHWIAGEHTFDAGVTDIEPTHDTAWAQKLNITEMVSTFTTYFPAGQERIKNIAKAASVVNNTVIEPGGTFSLNQKLGKRTAESGYVKAPVYSGDDGFTDDYGGGASQFSTTMFNAAFIGGYKDITHSPHSIYISRYPMGREATLNWGSIDMSFQDDSHSGIFVKTSVGTTSVTVTFYGNKEGRTVKLEGPNILSQTPITTTYTDDPTLPVGQEKEIAHGYPGIVVENYRTISRPGQPDKRERYRWTYIMLPRTAYRGTKPAP